MRNPISWQKLKDLWNGKAFHPTAILAVVGGASLVAYLMFAILPLFIPGADHSHFPPFLALPEGGFDLSNYYLLYSVICINALVLFALYLVAVRVSGLTGKPTAAEAAAAGRPLLRSEADAGAQQEAEAPGMDAPGEERPDGLPWYRAWPRDRTTQLIFGFTILFHVLMLLSPFLLSTDLFDYIRHGRIFAVYGENPMTVPATYFPQDPFFSLGGWVGTGSVYGPLHVYVAALLTRIAGDGIGANFLVFKGFFIAVNLLNVALIGMIARRLKPGLEKKAMLFFGWNPFILTLVAANGHNDILMLAFVLGGILCYFDRRLLFGALLITLAALVKFIAFPILIVYVILAVRQQQGPARRVAMALLSAVTVVGASLISYIPLWQGADTFSYLAVIGQKTNFSVPTLLRDLTAGHLQLSLSNTIVQLTLVALLAAYLGWHVLGVKDTSGLLSSSAGLALLTPLALFWFQPWYLTLALGLIALRPWWLMYRTALVFSFSVMFFDSFWWHTPISMDVQKPLRTLVVFGPPIVILLALKAREVLPGAGRRLMAWSLESASAVRSQRDVTAPALRYLFLEMGALFVAAAVPMALIISSSPQLRSLADLVAIKLKLLGHF